MGWLKINDGFFLHPSGLAAGRDGRMLYLAALCHASKYQTNGAVPRSWLDMLARDAGVDSPALAAASLVKAGLWAETEDGWELADRNLTRFPSPTSLAEIAGPLAGLSCSYCGAMAEAWDHIVPRSKGGPDTPENLTPACTPCNSSKHARTPEQWWASKADGPMPAHWPRSI